MERYAILCGAICLWLGGCTTVATRTTHAPLDAAPATRRTPPPPSTPRLPPPASTPAPAGVDPIARAIRVPGGVAAAHWQVIVIHHSASDNDSPASIDRWHRQRGWDGLGYHFVIGNGVNYPDGELYVGARWRSQTHGAHCKTGPGVYLNHKCPNNYFNDRGIGICLIGNLENHAPTPRQLDTLTRLIAALSQVANIPPEAVYGHGEITHRTACPGEHCDLAALRRRVRVALAGTTPLSAGATR